MSFDASVPSALKDENNTDNPSGSMAAARATMLQTACKDEYELADLSPSSRMQKFQDDLAYHRRPESDVEVCSSLESVEALARGEGAWSELPLMARREQLEHMIGICDELYPSLRWFLFPALRRFSVPLTVFGIKRAAIYVGQRYLVFNSREHVRALTHHFDDLIRAASHQPLETIAALRALRDAL